MQCYHSGLQLRKRYLCPPTCDQLNCSLPAWFISSWEQSASSLQWPHQLGHVTIWLRKSSPDYSDCQFLQTLSSHPRDHYLHHPLRRLEIHRKPNQRLTHLLGSLWRTQLRDESGKIWSINQLLDCHQHILHCRPGRNQQCDSVKLDGKLNRRFWLFPIWSNLQWNFQIIHSGQPDSFEANWCS